MYGIHTGNNYKIPVPVLISFCIFLWNFMKFYLNPSSMTVMAATCNLFDGLVPSRPQPATHVVVPGMLQKNYEIRNNVFEQKCCTLYNVQYLNFEMLNSKH
jgi:hypothetical protein